MHSDMRPRKMEGVWPLWVQARPNRVCRVHRENTEIMRDTGRVHQQEKTPGEYPQIREYAKETGEYATDTLASGHR